VLYVDSFIVPPHHHHHPRQQQRARRHQQSLPLLSSSSLPSISYDNGRDPRNSNDFKKNRRQQQQNAGGGGTRRRHHNNKYNNNNSSSQTFLVDKLCKSYDSLILQYKDYHQYKENNSQHLYLQKLVTRTIPTIYKQYHNNLLLSSSSSSSSHDEEQDDGEQTTTSAMNDDDEQFDLVWDQLENEIRSSFTSNNDNLTSSKSSSSSSTTTTSTRDVQERLIGFLSTIIQIECSQQQQQQQQQQKQAQQEVDDRTFCYDRIWDVCQTILQNMTNEGYVVSPIVITTLSKSIKLMYLHQNQNHNNNNKGGQTGATDILTLLNLVHQAKMNRNNNNNNSSSSVDEDDVDNATTVAFNIYLSTLSLDRAYNTLLMAAVGSDINCTIDDSSVLPVPPSSVRPDIDSYTTIMDAAAKVGNATLVDTLWMIVQSHGLKPDTRTYNARLRSVKDYRQRLTIFDDELKAKNQPVDQYTIDLLLLPFVRHNRLQDLHATIDKWIGSVLLLEDDHKSNTYQKQRLLGDAFVSFFVTLVNQQQQTTAAVSGSSDTYVHVARQLYDTYMMTTTTNDDPQELSTNSTSTSNTKNVIITPHRRHVNVLLDGYATIADQALSLLQRRQEKQRLVQQDDDDDEKEKESSTTSSSSTDDYDHRVFHEQCLRAVRANAIRQGRELFQRLMIKDNDGEEEDEEEEETSRSNNIKTFMTPDSYTWSTMMRLCESSHDVHDMIDQAATYAIQKGYIPSKDALSPVILRSALSLCNELNDPIMACTIFNDYSSQDWSSNYRTCNVLLGALASGAKHGNTVLEFEDAALVTSNDQNLLSLVDGMTCTDAVLTILDCMETKNVQTYVLAGSALQYSERSNIAMELYQNATNELKDVGDGRFINSIFRCYKDDIRGAIDLWKTSLRKACIDYDNRDDKNRRNSSNNINNKQTNLVAAYNGLLFVCGRSNRPDIAVRVVYAMQKEGIEPTETSYNNYMSGKQRTMTMQHQRQQQSSSSSSLETNGQQPKRLLLNKLFSPPKDLVKKQYEDLLFVECKKYNQRDPRTKQDQRVRIIV
jgi:pentatricopeptide repeat protein